ALRDLQALRHGKRTQRHNAERHARRNSLRRMQWVEIVDAEPERRGDDAAIVRGAEHRIVLLHGASYSKLVRSRWREANSDRPDVERQRNRIRATQCWMVPVEPARCAERGMAGEAKLFLRCEDAYAHTVALIVRRKNESSFRQVGLARERLHFIA